MMTSADDLAIVPRGPVALSDGYEYIEAHVVERSLAGIIAEEMRIQMREMERIQAEQSKELWRRLF